MGQAWGCRSCRWRRKRPDDFTFSNAFLEELKMISVYSERQLEKVFETFKKMDRSNTGQLSKEDFLAHREKILKTKRIPLGKPEKVVLPMEDRLWVLFDPTNKGYVTFRHFVEVTSALSLQGPRDIKIKHAYKMMDFDGDGRISEADIREYLTRITKLSQTKENLAAYEKARKQAQELDNQDNNPEEESKKSKKHKRRMSEGAQERSRKLAAARMRSRAKGLGPEVDSKIEVAESKSSPKNEAPAIKTADSKKTAQQLQEEEAASVEAHRIELIDTVAHTVILEAAGNGMYLTLQDFSKVVESDTEFFSHMNLYF